MLDINGDERLVSSKEAATAKIKVIAGFFREMEDPFRLVVSPDWEFDLHKVMENFSDILNDQ